MILVYIIKYKINMQKTYDKICLVEFNGVPVLLIMMGEGYEVKCLHLKWKFK